MDNIYLCGRTALLVWQRLRCLERPRLDALAPLADRLRQLGIAPARVRLIGTAGGTDAPARLASIPHTAGVSEPLELLVASREARHHAHGVIHRLWSGPVPPSAFAALGQGVYLSMPEFVFLQLARQSDPCSAMLLGYEICGAYALERLGEPASTRCQPLTSTARVAHFLGEAGAARGVEKAMRALRLVVGGSASPGETAMVALACAPRRIGGYGVPAPEMNHRIDVPAKLLELVGRDHLLCDAFWPGANHALEYDGEAFHAGSSDMARDRRRANCLATLGVSVARIDKDVLFNASKFDKAARQLMHDIGYRAPTRAFDTTWFHRRDKLRRDVLDGLFGPRPQQSPHVDKEKNGVEYGRRPT